MRALLRLLSRASGRLAAPLLASFLLPVSASSQSPPQSDGYRWVRPAVVNLRSGPGTQFDAVDQLRRGDRLWLVYVEDGWAEVQIPTDDGWQLGFIRVDLLVESETAVYGESERESFVASDSKVPLNRAESRRRTEPSGDLLPLFVLVALGLTIAGIARASHRRRSARPGRAPRRVRPSEFQNRGERRLSRLLDRNFGPPDYHLMNHITLRLGTGTTQIDHILLSPFGIFVIETKDYSGWIFGSAVDLQWTQVLHRKKFRFQNPILQNRRHVQAVSALLDFLPAGSIKSVVVFVGGAELKTPMPESVLYASEVVDYIRRQSTPIMSLDRLQLCVGRLETARLAVTGETDLEHIRNVERWHGHRA